METTKKVHEVKFVHEDVQICISGPYEEEMIFTGKVLIIHELHGALIEWRRAKECDSPERKRCSPDSETLDWEDVSSTVVGYRVIDQENSIDAVEFKPTSNIPSVISIEVSELKSYKQTEFPDKNRIGITFYLRDGSNTPALYFETESFGKFIEALKSYIVFKQSQKDCRLHLIIDPKEEALAKSFNELQLFEENKSHIVTKFFQDPYSTAMGGFSKVTNFLLDYLVYNNGTSSPTHCSDKMAELLTESLARINISQQEEHGFEVISCVELPPRPVVTRSEPVGVEEWLSHVDKDGRITGVKELKERIFKGGLIESLRVEVWKFLLGYYSFNSTTKERDAVRKRRIDDYYRMKLQWRSMTADQESRFTGLRDRKSLIEKDVSRTDRVHPDFEGDNNSNVLMLYDILMTYCMYNFDLGYVQGMSDMLSPVLVVMRNEADTFWCFASWLETVGANFEMDQQGMKTQLMNLHCLIQFVDSKFCSYLESRESGNLYFCFRWLLILFKRDFKFDEVMRLWEVLWTDLPCKNFHLLICVAILDTESSTIMENNYGLTEILKHINDVAYKIDLEKTLCKAEAIYLQIKDSCYSSDVVQEILGIPPSFNARLMIDGGLRSGQTKSERQDCNYHVFAVQEAQDERNTSPRSDASSVDNIDEFVDLESQYELSVGNFL